MCGRYTVTVDTDAIYDAFDWLAKPETLKTKTSADDQAMHFQTSAEWVRPRFNVCPTQPAPVILKKAEEPAALRYFKWGLIPFWSKDAKAAAKRINARVETVLEGKMFKEPFETKRCLVPTDGWFEWEREGKQKIPHHMARPGRALFTLAGVWSRWKPDRDGEERIYSFSILTREAEGELAALHHRMPVIVPPELRADYLDADAEPNALRGSVLAAPLPEIEVTKVTQRVNSVRNDDPACLEPAG